MTKQQPPKAQKLYDRDMQIVNFEVVKENVHAVKGQYITRENNMAQLSHKAQELYDRDMQIINFEVARENVHAVKGQYISQIYKEEAKKKPDQSYIDKLRERLKEIYRVLNTMYELVPEQIEIMMHDYGQLYKHNDQLDLDDRKLL